MTISRLINSQSEDNHQKIAVKHGKKILTYTQLSTKAAQVCRYLYAQGLQVNDVVALAADRNHEMIVMFVALANAGITYLPVDNNLPADRIDYMLQDAGIKFLITTKNHAEKYSNYKNIIFIDDLFEALSSYDSTALYPVTDPEGVAYILYTSGSTGRPKGVLVKRSGFLNLLLSIQQCPGITPGDVMLFTTTVSFDIAELEIFLPLVSGATLVIADADTTKDGRALIELAQKEKISIMQGTPFMWRTMLEAGWPDKLPIKIFCGGEAMTRQLADALVPRCNELWNMYGPTETTIYSIIKKIIPGNEVITVGKPVLNTQLYLLDEYLNEVADGEIGEIYIGGDGVAQGYLNQPDLTAERFITDKFSGLPGKMIYKTGDLGKVLPDGDMQCLGRVDHQIKIRGYRIEAEEIEEQLKLHSQISNALVVPYTDEAGNMHLVGYVVAKQVLTEAETEQAINDWKDHLAKILPQYMIPDIFMPLAAIPVMANGKTDRNALPKPVINKGQQDEYLAPQTPTEITLADIFLKNIAIEQIGINDNFFRMGIDSLIMVKVMVQIEKDFGKRYPLSILIKYPTLKELAWLVDNNVADSQYKSLIPIKPKGGKIPLYIVHGMGLNLLNMYHMVSMLDDEQPVYGMQAIGLDGTVEPAGTIEEIAAFYNNEILMHDPVGPYAISGYSFGGYIAYEMVKQLREAGKDVKMLAMFDTNLQTSTQRLSTAQKIELKIYRQFKKLYFRLSTFLHSPVKTLEYLLLQVPVYYYEFLNFIGIKMIYNPDQVPQYMQDIMKTMQRAFNRYEFVPQDVKIDMFKAAVKMYFVDDARYFGWSKYALKGVEVHIVPGDHREMFIAPNDRFLAQSLQNELNKIN